jgi:hypothetical protein
MKLGIPLWAESARTFSFTVRPAILYADTLSSFPTNGCILGGRYHLGEVEMRSRRARVFYPACSSVSVGTSALVESAENGARKHITPSIHNEGDL